MAGMGCAAYALLALWCDPLPHPSVWNEVAVAAGVRQPEQPFPFLYRAIVGLLFRGFSAGTALDLLPVLGRVCIACATACVCSVFRGMLPPLLHVRSCYASAGMLIGRLGAVLGSVLFLCADPVWRAGQVFSPTSLFLLLAVMALGCFFRFLQKGRLAPLFVCAVVLGVVSADSMLGIALAVAMLAGVFFAVGYAVNPEVPLVDVCVGRIVGEIAFKRLTLAWGGAFVVSVGLGVWQFCNAEEGVPVDAVHVLDILLNLLRAAVGEIKGAATGGGWLFGALLCGLPFILVWTCLSGARNEDRFLPWGVGVVYGVVGVMALTQLAGAPVLWFWTWLGGRSAVPDDSLLACALFLAVFAVVLAVSVFGLDATCRNYRRIAQRQHPESMFSEAPAQLAESLGRARKLRIFLFALAAVGVVAVTVPGRVRSCERGMLEIMAAYEREFMAETAKCDCVFTDGVYDVLHALACLREGRTLACRSLFERGVQEDLVKLVREDAPELKTAAVQIAFEIWRRQGKTAPVASGLCAYPGGVDDGERARACEAAERLDERVRELVAAHSPADSVDRKLRHLFAVVMFRLARLAQQRGVAAEKAGRREEGAREAERAEGMDALNYELAEVRERLANIRTQQNGEGMTSREGLVIGLARADFALAGRYADPVLRKDPDDPRANFAVGMHHLQEKNWSQAEQYLLRCLTRRPDEAAVHNNLALVQLHLGKFAEAEEHVRKALAQHPEVAEIKRTLQQILDARKAADGAARR